MLFPTTDLDTDNKSGLLKEDENRILIWQVFCRIDEGDTGYKTGLRRFRHRLSRLCIPDSLTQHYESIPIKKILQYELDC